VAGSEFQAMALHPGVKLWTIGFNECRMTNGGFARAAQALAPRVALSFYNRPFDKRLTTGRSTKDSRQAVRQKTHDRPFDKRLTTGRSTKSSRQAEYIIRCSIRRGWSVFLPACDELNRIVADQDLSSRFPDPRNFVWNNRNR